MWPQATKYNLAGCGLETCGFCALPGGNTGMGYALLLHSDSLCGKRSGQFISVLQLTQVACVPELTYVGVLL